MGIKCYTYEWNVHTLKLDKIEHQVSSPKIKYYEKILNILNIIAEGIIIGGVIIILLMGLFDIYQITFSLVPFLIGDGFLALLIVILFSCCESKQEKEYANLKQQFHKKHLKENKKQEMLLYDWCIRHPAVKKNADKFNISLYDAYVLTYHKIP